MVKTKVQPSPMGMRRRCDHVHKTHSCVQSNLADRIRRFECSRNDLVSAMEALE